MYNKSQSHILQQQINLRHKNLIMFNQKIDKTKVSDSVGFKFATDR